MATDEAEMVDYSLVHAVPGHGIHLNYCPDENDPLLIGDPLPCALSDWYLDEGGAV
jgi:hypothetical protein